MRQVVVVQTGGYEFVGTWHLPPGGAERDPDVGFVFLNAGHLPRDGHAGISVRTAQALTRLGHHVMRFDLPGLGDSPGELPHKTDDLFQMIHDGWYAEPAVVLARELRRRFHFRRVVLGGLCGAAGTGLLAAVRDPDSIAGIVAIELELFQPVPEVPLNVRESLVSRAAWLRLLSGHSRYSHLVRIPGQPMLNWIGPALLPAHADRPLARALRDTVRRGTPVLVIMAAGKRREVFYDQVKKALLQGRPYPNLTEVSLPGTNHILTTGGAQAGAVEAVATWASSHFPSPARQSPSGATRREAAVTGSLQKAG
jgi:alpha-beta hydrolase superfamily lysophospholipase